MKHSSSFFLLGPNVASQNKFFYSSSWLTSAQSPCIVQVFNTLENSTIPSSSPEVARKLGILHLLLVPNYSILIEISIHPYIYIHGSKISAFHFLFWAAEGFSYKALIPSSTIFHSSSSKSDFCSFS
ncbi:hypothetical protein CFOL_v3_33329 [Cephalotus follicularis]|uniref:Uncharacterized protein n=1 Tax=Cephalotus follicularis TaxID=3775 RepID=A0A1Q3DBQ4_CEPFO|nr:hypothetical protein CFOL_v3_33329 [Cephalotus follicularis]